VLRFLREHVFHKEQAETASSLVYQAYTNWCATNHERPLSIARFNKQLEGRGFEHDRVHTRAHTGSLWRHLRLRR
jgi:phage/plasmid-associated DNA primase